MSWHALVAPLPPSLAARAPVSSSVQEAA